jgi:hypothetical protein
MAKRKRFGRVRDRTANRDAKLESAVEHERVEANEGPAFDSPVDVFVNHYRTRLLDPSNCCIKAAEDAIVAGGVLRDDSAKEVREVRHRQIKVKDYEDEKTVVMIRPVK